MIRHGIRHRYWNGSRARRAVERANSPPQAARCDIRAVAGQCRGGDAEAGARHGGGRGLRPRIRGRPHTDCGGKEYGARGVGIEIDPMRLREANDNLKKAGVGDRVRFVQQDLFEAEHPRGDRRHAVPAHPGSISS